MVNYAMSFNVSKTAMYIKPQIPPHEGLMSQIDQPDMVHPTSIVGNPSLAGVENEIRYHVHPEELKWLLQYLIGLGDIGSIRVIGKSYDYTNGHYREMGTVNIRSYNTTIQFNEYLNPIMSDGLVDLSTIDVMKLFYNINSDSIYFHTLGVSEYEFVKSNFVYPVAVRRCHMNRPVILEFMDVLAGILHHGNCTKPHPTTRVHFNIEDITPIRNGLDEHSYSRYTDLYGVLRSVSYDTHKFIQPRRILVGNAYEFVSVPPKEFRDEYNEKSGLPTLQTRSDDWSNDLHFSDIHPDHQVLHQLANFLGQHGGYTLQGQNIILDSSLSSLYRQRESRDQQERQRYYRFCLNLSKIFMTPLLLFRLPAPLTGHHVIDVDDVPIVKPLPLDYLQLRNTQPRP